MEVKEFMREFGRMCEHYTPMGCHMCKMSIMQNGTGLPCMRFAKHHPEEAVRIVEEFRTEHPPKTLKDLVLEKFPDADVLGICPRFIWKSENDKFIKAGCRCKGRCRECWNRPAEEVED